MAMENQNKNSSFMEYPDGRPYTVEFFKNDMTWRIIDNRNWCHGKFDLRIDADAKAREFTEEDARKHDKTGLDLGALLPSFLRRPKKQEPILTAPIYKHTPRQLAPPPPLPPIPVEEDDPLKDLATGALASELVADVLDLGGSDEPS